MLLSVNVKVALRVACVIFDTNFINFPTLVKLKLLNPATATDPVLAILLKSKLFPNCNSKKSSSCKGVDKAKLIVRLFVV